MTSEWTRDDYIGAVRSRISNFRMRYSVEPGLCAIGEPDSESDVFVSANYKLSFDILRRKLKGMNAWILVLDTKGINVWCAAGKGTFGTDELVRQINQIELHKVVNHRRIIVPQLGAVGVNARAVQQATGFRVHFGPVHAKDIPAYIAAGYKKTEGMRLVKFSMLDRLVLTPMEINPAMKKYPVFALIVLMLFGLQPSGILFKDALSGGLPFLLLGLTSVLSGAFVTPVMLPFIPFRSFAIKGFITGMLAVFLITKSFGLTGLSTISAYLFFPVASSYIALQFTGSTTFTSMSGVKKELKIAIPIYLTTTALSQLLLVIYKLFQWEIL
ncbi:MAG: mercury methylation corrinoid protein HgcA [Thermodesulfovibrionales bacterium]|nr:mercury methylation corrinoid protein HgcA [Thermodesulfovibrionales bacterium]